MPLVAGLVAALIATATAPAPAPAPERAAADADAIRARAARILSGREYQGALPRPQAPPPRLDLRFPALAKVLRVLAYGAALAIALLVAAWLVRRLRRAPRDVALPAASPAAAPVAIPIASAEALAARGRHGEAIHALLLETLSALSRGARLAPSLTSREIVERARLPGRAREALAGLVVAVELSRFGGAEPGEGEYRACLDRFHAFVQTYRSAA